MACFFPLAASAIAILTAVATAASAQTGGQPPPPAAHQAAQCPSLLRHTVPRLQDEAPQDLCQFAGRVLLVVNTASYCGYTGQYDGLEKLYARYRARGFVVLGFPSNDFGRQEPGTNRQIAEFCENTFGVRFPMFSKTRVSGTDAHPLFASLARDAGTAPRWNFHKYLVGRDGRLVASFPSATEPGDAMLQRAIENSLREPGPRPG